MVTSEIRVPLYTAIAHLTLITFIAPHACPSKRPSIARGTRRDVMSMRGRSLYLVMCTNVTSGQDYPDNRVTITFEKPIVHPVNSFSAAAPSDVPRPIAGPPPFPSNKAPPTLVLYTGLHGDQLLGSVVRHHGKLMLFGGICARISFIWFVPRGAVELIGSRLSVLSHWPGADRS
jgi:hypothetical protein